MSLSSPFRFKKILWRGGCGLILAPLSVIAIAIVFRKGTETVGTVGGIITMIQMIPLAGVIIKTEIALKNNFGENGRRK